MNLRKVFWYRGRIRAGWRIAIFLIITGVSLAVVLYPFLQLRLPSEVQQLVVYFILFSGVLLCSFLMAKYFDHRPSGTIGYRFYRRWWRDYLLGVVIGWALVTLIFAAEGLLGYLEVQWVGFSFSLLVRVFGFSLIYFVFQSAFEEVLFRGYLFQTLIEGTNVLAAVVIFSAVFGLLHMMNPNALWLGGVNTIVAGLMFCLAYLRTRGLWLASGLHFGWNYFLGSIYGLPVSGISSSALLSVKVEGPVLITGGEYGPEGGIIGLTMFLLGTLYIALSRRITIPPEMKDYDASQKRSFPPDSERIS